MSDEELKLLFHSLGEQVLERETNPAAAASMLLAETLRFQKKLKEDTGVIFTLSDTRKALDGLESYLKGEPLEPSLSSEQKALAMILIDNMTIFRKS